MHNLVRSLFGVQGLRRNAGSLFVANPTPSQHRYINRYDAAFGAYQGHFESDVYHGDMTTGDYAIFATPPCPVKPAP